jgi:hypothetical protein
MAPDPSSVGGDDRAEAQILSFVIRIWIEAHDAGGSPMWRGQITRVPSGERRSIDTLDAIALFILEHLQGYGVRPPLLWSLRRRRRRGAGGL